MEKIISTRQFATIKRVAMSVNPMVSKKETLTKKILEMVAEVRELNDQIAGFETGIKAMCNGLSTENLVHKVVSTTDKVDKTGKPITKTSYEPNECLKYDEEHNWYVLTINEEEQKNSETEEINNLEENSTEE